MVIIHTGRRWDISRGETVIYKGTAAYLKAIRAEPIPDTAEEVDEADINQQGRFNPRSQLQEAGEISRAHPVEGKINYGELSREHLARYPKIRARLAE